MQSLIVQSRVTGKATQKHPPSDVQEGQPPKRTRLFYSCELRTQRPVEHNQSVEELAKLIEKLPTFYAIAVTFLAVTEIMAIASAVAMKKVGGENHPLFNPMLWLIGLPPLGVAALTVVYFGDELWGWLLGIF